LSKRTIRAGNHGQPKKSCRLLKKVFAIQMVVDIYNYQKSTKVCHYFHELLSIFFPLVQLPWVNGKTSNQLVRKTFNPASMTQRLSYGPN
jgi:hypothetical protein